MEYEIVKDSVTQLLKLDDTATQEQMVAAGQQWVEQAEGHGVEMMVAETHLRHSIWDVEKASSLEELEDTVREMKLKAARYAQLLGM